MARWVAMARVWPESSPRIADGPDEVHKMTIVRRELHRFEADRSS
jgi:hypothetical protein